VISRRGPLNHAARRRALRTYDMPLAMSAAVSIVRRKSSVFLIPRQVDRHGVRLLSGQDAYNSERDCK
jgi:hypothetical protein